MAPAAAAAAERHDVTIEPDARHGPTAGMHQRKRSSGDRDPEPRWRETRQQELRSPLDNDGGDGDGDDEGARAPWEAADDAEEQSRSRRKKKKKKNRKKKRSAAQQSRRKKQRKSAPPRQGERGRKKRGARGSVTSKARSERNRRQSTDRLLAMMDKHKQHQQHQQRQRQDDKEDEEDEEDDGKGMATIREAHSRRPSMRRTSTLNAAAIVPATRSRGPMMTALAAKRWRGRMSKRRQVSAEGIWRDDDGVKRLRKSNTGAIPVNLW